MALPRRLHLVYKPSSNIPDRSGLLGLSHNSIFRRYRGTAAAARVLFNDELIRQVIDNLCPEGQNQKSLLSLALSAKAFTESALQKLWAEQSTLRPLFNVLSHAVDLDNATSWLDEFMTTAYGRTTPGTPKFARFVSYANMVRTLRWSGCDNLDAKLGLFMVLKSGGISMLPQLRTFCWEENYTYHFPLYRLFIGPSIRHLQLSWDPRALLHQCFNIRHFFDWVSCQNLSLSSLSIQITMGDRPWLSLPADYFLSCSVIADGVNEFVESQKDSLRNVSIGLGSPFSGFLPSSDVVSAATITSLSFQLWHLRPDLETAFPNLKSLRLEFPYQFEAHAQVIKQFQCPELENLELSFGTRATSFIYHAMSPVPPQYIYLNGVVLASFARHVRSLTVVHYSDDEREQADLFEALLACPLPQLTALDVTMDVLRLEPCDLLATLPRAYPDLAVLALRRTPHMRRFTAPLVRCTLLQAQALLHQLPRVHTLTLEVETFALADPRTRALLAKRPCARLRRWDAVQSFVDWDGWREPDLGRVARAVRAAFPNVAEVQFMPLPDHLRNDLRWREINRWLRGELKEKNQFRECLKAGWAAHWPFM